EAGIPAIKVALGIAGAGTAEMVDHCLLVADYRSLVARPELAVNRVFAGRADHHHIRLKQNCLLGLDISCRVALPVGSGHALRRCGSEQHCSQDDLSHRIPPTRPTSAVTMAAYPAIYRFQEQAASLPGLCAANQKNN